jgi:RNA polymerase sigma-70 factor (ECF subfamily)
MSARIARQRAARLSTQRHARMAGLDKRPVETGYVAAAQPKLQAPPASECRERSAMLRLVPTLRAFAASLTGNIDAADDLVQETLVRAMTHIDSFEAGTNLGAWMFTILRNLFYSQHRRKRQDDYYRLVHSQMPSSTHAEQHGKIELKHFRRALLSLPRNQREAIILVGGSGYSYEEAAEICGCATGTVKSRVSRARTRLAKLVDADSPDRFGPDRQELAIVA